MKNKQSFYLDINIFRPITRELDRWKKFAAFFDKEKPCVLDSPIHFTWSQLLEAVDLEKILVEIKKKAPCGKKQLKRKIYMTALLLTKS